MKRITRMVVGGLSLFVVTGAGGQAAQADICAPAPKPSITITDDFVYENENAVVQVKLSNGPVRP